MAALVCCAALALFACGEPTPTGQVVAVANGDEVTLGELRAEAAARDPAAGGTPAPSQRDLLRVVLDRKLWAEEARRGGLDRDVGYILARRRSDEALLAEMQVRALTEAVAPPTEVRIDRFLREHPGAFASRTVFAVDQINVRSDDDALPMERFAQPKSLDAIDAMLTRLGIVAQRSRTEWNSTFMPASVAATLGRLRPDELFFHRNGDTLIAARVIGRTTVPLGYPERRMLVRQSMTRKKVEAVLAERLAELRAAAGIRFQPGFAPARP